VIGEPLDECIGNQQVYVGKNAGVWFSDDDVVLMSAKSYREFVVPYNSRILKTFGGGCVHYCGNAAHQAENFLATEGLRAINNYTLYDFAAFRKTKAHLEGRIPIFACDFTAIDYPHYFPELLEGLSYAGLFVSSSYLPVAGLLKGGRYEPVHRDVTTGRRAVYEFLSRYLRKHRKTA